MIIRIFICIFIAGWTLYSLIVRQNELVELRLAIPQLQKEVQQIEEENTKLQYEVDLFESPIHLMELAKQPAFSHLKFPYNKDVLVIPTERVP